MSAWNLDAATRCMTDKQINKARANLSVLQAAYEKGRKPGYSQELIEELVYA